MFYKASLGNILVRNKSFYNKNLTSKSLQRILLNSGLKSLPGGKAQARYAGVLNAVLAFRRSSEVWSEMINQQSHLINPRTTITVYKVPGNDVLLISFPWDVGKVSLGCPLHTTYLMELPSTTSGPAILILSKPHQSRIVNLQIFSGTIAPVCMEVILDWFKFAQTLQYLHWSLKIVGDLRLHCWRCPN